MSVHQRWYVQFTFQPTTDILCDIHTMFISWKHFSSSHFSFYWCTCCHCICTFRKITAEESTRISIENQLQSEQAKASTAVVDADKYRYLSSSVFFFFLFSPPLKSESTIRRVLGRCKKCAVNIPFIAKIDQCLAFPCIIDIAKQKGGENYHNHQLGYNNYLDCCNKKLASNFGSWVGC